MSGIGFIGRGVIFVRRDLVRGPTTAAGVWASAAIGMAAGGDLPALACATTVIYLLVSSVYPEVKKLLPRSRTAPGRVRPTYLDGKGVLRELLGRCSEYGSRRLRSDSRAHERRQRAQWQDRDRPPRGSRIWVGAVAGNRARHRRRRPECQDCGQWRGRRRVGRLSGLPLGPGWARRAQTARTRGQ